MVFGLSQHRTSPGQNELFIRGPSLGAKPLGDVVPGLLRLAQGQRNGQGELCSHNTQLAIASKTESHGIPVRGPRQGRVMRIVGPALKVSNDV